MKPELTYIVTFFQILSSLIDDNNTVNMGKVVKRFPFDRLVYFLKASSNCWPLKRNIRTFLNRMYYFQPEVETNLKTILLD
jgi:inositol 1,4,5-triphosphate receptor type 1/inositol 1,4,5-triphosphate receptor type 3